MCVGIDLERLKSLLSQADEKLAAANQSLEMTRRQKEEQEARCVSHICVVIATVPLPPSDARSEGACLASSL